MTCDQCGQRAEVRDVEFGWVIGAILVRFDHTEKGRLCADCTSAAFWKCTLITLFLGWWGITSFFLTPVILIMNVLAYRAVFLSPPYPADPLPTALSSNLVKALEPCRDEIFQRVLKGEKMDQVSEEIGKRVGATAAEVKAFYNNAFYTDRGA